MAPAKIDLYQSVTNHIISTIENLSEDDHLIMPWHRSGLSELPTNVESNNHYNGVNILSLWVSAIDRGFTSNIWGTFRQWKKAGAQVRKGEKSTLVIFYKEYLAEDESGQKQTQRFARASWAFNIAQVDGFEIPAPEKASNPIDRIKAVDIREAIAECHHEQSECHRPPAPVVGRLEPMRYAPWKSDQAGAKRPTPLATSTRERSFRSRRVVPGASAVSTRLIKNVCDGAGSGGQHGDWCRGFSAKTRGGFRRWPRGSPYIP